MNFRETFGQVAVDYVSRVMQIG